MLVVDDAFAQPVGRGRVVGSSAGAGVTRSGRDVEGVLSVDDGALRIAPLERPGWGRSALSYEPVTPEPGLAMAVHVLNGHQASQSYALRRLVPRIREWLRGSGTGSGVERVRRCLTERRRVSGVARVRGWARRTGGSDSPVMRRIPALRRLRIPPGDEPAIIDNLVVGFLRGDAATSPRDVAAGLAVRSTGNLNGALGPVVDGEVVPVLDRLAAVPFRLLTIVRDDSTLYALARPAGTGAGAGSGAIEPLAVGPPPPAGDVWPGVQQNVAGEIGFSVDTRVLGVRVVRSPELAPWHAGAHLADDLTGAGPAVDAAPAVGPGWSITGPTLCRGADGLSGPAGAVAIADPGHPTGLVRLVTAPGVPLAAALLWRASGVADHLRLELAAGRWRVGRRTHGRDHWLAHGPLPDHPGTVQVHDIGGMVTVVADATVLAAMDVAEQTGGAGHHCTGVGLESLGGDPLGVARIEALPDALVLPAELDLPSAPLLPHAGPPVFEDHFDDVVADLAGRSPDGVRSWRRELGDGRIAITGPGRAQIVAAPGRTAYTVDWPEHRFAELTTTITPVREPGSRSRAGLVAMQDADDYLSVNLWFNDRPDGAASVSSFFMLDGHEDVYDAVWVNVHDRVRWDTPVEMRLGFDGSLYQVWLDDELVLWRRISDVYPGTPRLDIRRVGLLANWEWGLDTGSRFGSFVARGPRP